LTIVASSVWGGGEFLGFNIRTPMLRNLSGPKSDRFSLHSFTVSGGKANKKAPPVSDDDYERAEKAIAHAVEKMEEAVHHAVETEVDTFFHDLEHPEKDKVKEKAKKAVQGGAEKARKALSEHDRADNQPFGSMHYPYDWPHADPDHRILHAVESAEKAVLHAIQDEVGTLFHDLEHHDDREAAKKAEKVVKKGVSSAHKKVEESHEARRSWLKDSSGKRIEEYLQCDLE